MNRARDVEFVRETENVFRAGDIDQAHALLPSLVQAVLAVSGVMHDDVCAAHGRAHRFALGDITCHQLSAHFAQQQCLWAIRFADQRGDAPAASQQGLGEGPSDEPGSSRKKDFHVFL
jgi:hypothetical protein